MGNTDYFHQLEDSRRHIFGNGELGLLASVDPQVAAEIASKMPLPTKDIKYVECHEDNNGEFVPVKSLEKNVSQIK